MVEERHYELARKIRGRMKAELEKHPTQAVFQTENELAQMIAQAEPAPSRGLEECVEAILDKHKEDFPLMDVKCGNELRSSLLEILRTLAPLAHIEAAAEEIWETFSPHIHTDRVDLPIGDETIPDILRGHFKPAPMVSKDREGWALETIKILARKHYPSFANHADKGPMVVTLLERLSSLSPAPDCANKKGGCDADKNKESIPS